ncbi:hypothetical protein Emed_003724 [Eimeria media]
MGHEARHETICRNSITGSLEAPISGDAAKTPDFSLEEKVAWQSGNLAMPQPPEFTPLATEMGKTWRGFDKEEVLRLILQTLEEMGYRSVAASLEEASKVELLKPDVRMLKRSVLTAEWQEAGRALVRLPLDRLTRQACWFLLMQHKFLEVLLDPESTLERKIACLRIAPKQPKSTETLIASGAADKSVCVWVLTTNKDSHDKSSSTGQEVEGDPSAHSQLWSRWLGAWLEKEGDSAMRLEETQPLSITERGTVVATCRLAWRNQRLASAAAFLDWDSTGTILAVGSEAAFIEAWEEGRRIADFCTHSGALIALQWVPGSRQLISIGSDRIMSLITLQQSGFLLTHVIDYEWSLPARPQEGFLLPGGGSIIVFFADRQAKVFDVVTKEETFW